MTTVRSSRCRRSSVVIAGALFVAPLAALAFRSPTASTPMQRCQPSHHVGGTFSSPHAGRIRSSSSVLHSSVLPDAERQQSPTKKSFPKIKVSSVKVTPQRDVQKRNLQQKAKSTSNNNAMSDPVFLRKRTQTLLRVTSVNYDTDHNLSLSLSNNGKGLKVDKKTFDWLIDAWAHSGQKDSSQMALSLLERMEDLRDLALYGGWGEAAKVTPDAKTFTKVVNAISRSGRSDAGERAETVLKSMERNNIRPNTLTYTYVVDAYSRSASPQAAVHAQRIVDQMEQLRSEGDVDVKPTARAWNSVIGAWAQWDGEGASGAERAEACLEKMEKLAKETGNKDVRPNSYNCNSVISALANSKEVGAASRAEKILEKLERLYRETGDEISFNTVLNAWAKSGDADAPERARDVLRRMEELEASGLKVSPDATSFATAINAYARSHTFGKAQSAYGLFLHMKELYDATGNASLQPNNVVYNSVLNACAFTVGDLEEQSRAIEIANAMLVGLGDSEHGNPDQVTYGTYLKVLSNQMPASKAQVKAAEAVFKRCAKDGMVGDMVIRQLREINMDDESYQNLVGKSFYEEVGLGDLPSSWTCNVIEGKRMRRRQFRH
ncbi:predicted protein [Thalassiosira pseudonana CCMP1335]|uniref:Pentacotripeptide-repeat region of PRORP domain-containing protein n=1 Tax=Thalassiosira pseudonana TaxID=35128 RepID=B8BRS8_THAPS|nr:predicted protein [Thalassiosira pseudonana CCMP1335]EED96595.1 predicted protein [Thalassiosira pseudonana CCMP1335]